jgi:ribonucleoside-diphosphate reductase alpha chain
MARAAHDVVPVVPQEAKPARPRGKSAARSAEAAAAAAVPAGSAEAVAARTDAAFAEAAAIRARAEEAAAAAMAALRFTGEGTRGLTFERRWTRPGVHPYDEIAWEIRTAAIGNESGKLVFEQKDVEVPASWSQLATNVVVSKYFRGHLNTPERETSVRQLIDRVVLSISAWAEAQHYFAAPEDLATFTAELTHLLVHQKMSFNSPVWFNVGIEAKPQCSACFINSVQDSMTSIMDLAKTEAMLFKFGSGAGSNLSTIRSSREKMAGGGTASGPVSFMKGYDSFAGVVKCILGDSYVTTGGGLLRIDEAIEADGPVGFTPDDSLTLNTPAGPTRISHVYRSPRADVRRVELRTGLGLTGTLDHPVLTLGSGLQLRWVRLADLRPGDRVAVERKRELWPSVTPKLDLFATDLVAERRSLRYPTEVTPELARLLGYLVAEGSIGARVFTFSSADPEIMADFLRCLQAVFGPDVRAQVRDLVHPTTGVVTQVINLGWRGALQFLEFCGLPTGRSADKGIPLAIRRSPRSLVLEFLAAYAEGDAHLGASRIEIATASSRLAEEIQLIALNLGVVGRRSTINGYSRLAFLGTEAARLARLLRPYLVTPRKRDAAAALVAVAADRNPNLDVIPGLVPALRSLLAGPNGWARTTSGELVQTGFGIFNRSSDNVSYARTRAIPGLVDQVGRLSPAMGGTIERVLDDEYLWDEVVAATDAGQALTYDFTVPGVHAFVSNGIVSHNSGGKTRRAAKMVILDVGHPDILDFVDSKKLEEQKAWALIEQGYDPSFTGEAYGSVFFQNANHSVRVTDEFMRAVEADRPWTTHAVVSGEPMETIPARTIFRRMAEAAHVCGDPGIQYDTTINDWNPVASSDRQYATNPCSEFSFLNDTSCNLASVNLMKFVGEDGELDVEAYRHACRVTITAQEIIVDNASYPTPKIEENSHRFRPLGLGYANLGALLMSRGLAYDSPEGQAYAAALTSIMTAEAYRQSAIIARDHGGPFVEFEKNREPFMAVIDKHRAAATQIPTEGVPAGLSATARALWDETHALGEQHGYRNAQTTLLAPTGCLVGDSLVLTDRGLVRLRGLGNPDGEKWQELDLRVATDDGPREATRFFVNGAEPVVTVETSRGYRIQGTTTHRIRVVDTNGDWQWRRFADLRAGDRVPMTLGGLIGEPREVPLPPLPEAYWTSDHRTFVPRYMNADLAELVGYFMGDGSLHARGLRFGVAAGDDDVVARIVELGRRLFGLDAAVASKTGYTEVALHSVRLTLWWEACGFAKHAPNGEHRGKGYEAHIPDAVLYTNDAASYRAFVRGLFEADGNVNNGYASFSTVSDRFSREVQTLLLTLGFATTRKVDQPMLGHKGANPIHVLRLLNASSGGRFLAEISFVSERKRSALARKEYRQAARYDLVPVSRAMVDRLAPVNDHLRKTMLMSLSRTGLVSRRSASALLERTADPELAQALGYFYDEIASATLGAEQLTYDLSVPANVTYVANGFVSHNTIAFMMDCDTTGIEPDIALVKYKKLVGEGYLKIVNNTVPGALRHLGYTPTQVEEIVAFIDERETIEGAPALKPEHLPVFDCAFKPRNGTRSIAPMGHVRMMAAVQPFLSGAISKTVNMPEAATIDEIEQIYLEGWRLGLKAIAIYRDNSKRSQPLSTSKLKSDDETKAASEIVEELRRQLAVAQVEATKPHRRRLPAERTAVTHKFEISGHEGYITVGLYPDGQPGEIFLKMAKEGSTVSGLMDTFATAISLALQYGVPLRDLVNKFAHVRFEPSGFTGNSEIPIAKSTIDYIFRWLGSRFLTGDDRLSLGIQDGGSVVPATPFSFGAAVTGIAPAAAYAPEAEEGPLGIDEANEPPATTATAVATAEAKGASPQAGAKMGSAGATGTAAPGSSSTAGKLDLPVVEPATNGHASGNGNGHASGNGNGAASALAASLGAERTAFKIQEDAPSCMECGSIMVRNGSCYKCLNCGATSGCS